MQNFTNDYKKVIFIVSILIYNTKFKEQYFVKPYDRAVNLETTVTPVITLTKFF